MSLQTHIHIKGVCFVLSNHNWSWGLLWSVADKPSVTLLERLTFPFLQASVANSLLVKGGISCQPPFVWFELCRSCAWCYSLCVCRCHKYLCIHTLICPAVFGECCFLGVIHPSTTAGFYNILNNLKQ